jgi:hypothetical protein
MRKRSCKNTGPTLFGTGTSAALSRPSGKELTLSAPASLAKMSACAEIWKDCGEANPASGSTSSRSRRKLGRRGLLLNLFPDCCGQTEEETFIPLSIPWGDAGLCLPTGFLTLDIGESHSRARESSLSDILEIGTPPRASYLSPAACAKVLATAERNGIDLPAQLMTALRSFSKPAAPATGGECPA